MTNGKNKEILRTMFKEFNPNKEPINVKTGKPTKAYEDFLLSTHPETRQNVCKPHWTTVVSKFGKRTADIDTGKMEAIKALELAKRETILEEKCAIGIGGTIASKRKAFEEKYNIKF